MISRSPLLSSALLTGLLLAAPQAEARFGKASQPSESSREDKRDSGSSTHEATPVRNSDSTHDATPVGESRPSRPRPGSGGVSYRPDRGDDRGARGDSPRRDSSRRVRYHPSRGYYYVEPGDPLYYGAPAVAQGSEEYREAKNFLFGFDLQIVPGGTSAGVHLGLEIDRWGGMVRAGALSLRADDGGATEDSIRLLQAHVSWAPLIGRHGRVRLEGGVSVAQAPDITFVGPSLGTSAELYLGRTVSFEARLHVTPFPYRQLDTAGGLVVYLLDDVVALRGGMRLLVLDDAGKVDGVVHQDILPGPYVSIGMAI